MVRVKYSDELYHHGIKGQKWGVRRWQNPDGTLTPEGVKRYGKGEAGITAFERSRARKTLATSAGIGTAAGAGAGTAAGLASMGVLAPELIPSGALTGGVLGGAAGVGINTLRSSKSAKLKQKRYESGKMSKEEANAYKKYIKRQEKLAEMEEEARVRARAQAQAMLPYAYAYKHI